MVNCYFICTNGMDESPIGRQHLPVVPPIDSLLFFVGEAHGTRNEP